MSYSTRIDDVQASYNEFKSFLNFYLTTRLNKGFNDVNQQFSNTGLLDLNEFVKDESWLDVSTGNNFPSFFDFPMYVKSYGPGGKLGYGVTPDIGFTRNVEKNIKWTQGNMPSSRYWESVCYGNGKYVAVTTNLSNIMAYSTDGISWTEGTMPGSINWQSICYGNDKFVAVGGTNTNIMAYSTDGISWTQGTMPSRQSWYSVCYGNGKYVAVSGNTSNIMAYSTDGISWTQGNLPSTQKWRSVCYGNGKYIAVATANTNIMAYSTDGISWTQGNMPSNEYWSSVCYGNGKYIAVAGMSTIIMAYSTDGISWTQGNMPSVRSWQSVCYGNGKYVAVNNTSNIFTYSTDGISWTQGTMPSGQNWCSVCYGNDKYVAIASNNSDIMAYSTDAYSFPNIYAIINGLIVDYQYPFTKLLSGLKLSVNEPENYYFQLSDNTSKQLFTVPMPSTSTVQYLRNNYSRLFPIVSPNGNLFVFASFYRSSSNGGLVLYVSPDLIHWNIHQLIPGTATSTEVNTLIGTTFTSLSLSSSNATIMQNALRKYVGFLPNGQYVVMYPYEMYKQSGDNKQNMAVLYSPYQNEPLMTINDPYGDEDWENKAINGISAIVDKYGCFDIYYNNRLNYPISLGLNALVNLNITAQHVEENTGIPVIVKAKNNYTTGETLYQWNLEASTAPGTHDGTGAAGGTKDVNAPLLATAICTLDKDSEMLEDMPLNVRLCSVIGDYGSGQYKSITLLTKEATPYAGNTDEDMSNYITEFYNPSNLDYGTNFGISFKDKSFFVYIPTTDEISKKTTIARITVIGDTASNYPQTEVSF